MELYYQILAWVDAVLIAPYRWFSDPVAGWWVGTFILGLLCVWVGELTSWVLHKVNREYLEEIKSEMRHHHRGSIGALTKGDKAAWKGINRLANESFGRAFFMYAAMGIASLWPAFLGAGWLQMRFLHVQIPVPGLGVGVTYLAGFIICYIGSWILWSIAKRRFRAWRYRPELDG